MPVNPDSSSSLPERIPAESVWEPESSVDKQLLDSVIHQTSSALDFETLIRTDVWPRLCDVARRHASDSLTIDPILIEMISTVLEVQLPAVFRSNDVQFRTKVARAVAQPLFDNPASRGRLELLWSQLLGQIQ